VSLVSMRQAYRCVAFVLVLAGCGGGESAGPGTGVDVAGTWSGRVTLSGSTASTLQISITEHGNDVSGTGWLKVTTDSLGLSVSGSYDSPSLTATISSQGFEPMQLTATVSETEMVGTLDGSGFENRAITLRRQ
jgi:hypothetical protein